MILQRTSTPLLRADFKLQSQDFQVDEELGFECTGQGEHLWLLVRKTGLNTQDVAQRLARAAGIALRDVSWSGLKDKHGVCRQWFSLHLPGKQTPDALHAVECDALQIEQMLRNNRKLRRGSHRANHFVIQLRKLRLLAGAEAAQTPTAVQLEQALAQLEQNLLRVQQQGVPNYFGEQRFGSSNLAHAHAWFAGEYRPRNPVERGLLLSAARSAIFNAVLSRRVQSDHWNQYLEGDVMNLNGSASVFVPELGEGGPDESLLQRLAEGDIHPTGPLWGRGDMRTQGLCRELEEQVAAEFAELVSGLLHHQLDGARRSLRLTVQALHYRLSNSPDCGAGAGGPDLELSFTLPAGTYATAVLHDLIEYKTL